MAPVGMLVATGANDSVIGCSRSASLRGAEASTDIRGRYGGDGKTTYSGRVFSGARRLGSAKPLVASGDPYGP